MMFNHFCSIYLRIRYVLLKLACLICVPMSCLHTFTDKLPCCVNQDIIRLPRLFQFLQQPLAKLISVLRAPKSKEGYAAIGGGSPLRKITDEQVEQIHNLSCWNVSFSFVCIICLVPLPKKRITVLQELLLNRLFVGLFFYFRTCMVFATFYRQMNSKRLWSQKTCL